MNQSPVHGPSPASSSPTPSTGFKSIVSENSWFKLPGQEGKTSPATPFSKGRPLGAGSACPVPVWFKNALVSVSDKTGLTDFIRPLTQQGMRVVSTGGTAQHLRTAGISVVEISRQTGFDEVMDGRVKTLHPRIYMPLLARQNHLEDHKILEQKGLAPFDLVVCNLYPFLEKKQAKTPHLTEWIDVGGPSMLRASAKNFEQITVLCDPADYKGILQTGPPDRATRKKLAGKAFALLAQYNQSIADWLLKHDSHKPPPDTKHDKKPPPDTNHDMGQQLQNKQDLHIKAGFFQSLPYGENPHQKAGWFQTEKEGLHGARLLQGKPLSFNNISDMDSAVSLLRELDMPSAVAVKHNNPCGVACHESMEKAIEGALKADPVSVFGGVVALNREVSEEGARLLCSLFLSAVLAPDYTDSALALFRSQKKNLRVLKWKYAKQASALSFRSVAGGLLLQEQSLSQSTKEWQFPGQKPSPALMSDLLMAWKVSAHLKSNAIALVSGNQTVGLGMGQVNRVSAVESAIKNWKSFHPHVPAPVMASDGFFPFTDSVQLAGQAGLKWIVQPGGSIRDQEVMAKAKALAINMVLTGQRVFSH